MNWKKLWAIAVLLFFIASFWYAVYDMRKVSIRGPYPGYFTYGRVATPREVALTRKHGGAIEWDYKLQLWKPAIVERRQ